MRFPLFSLSLKSLANRRVSVILTIISIAASVMLFTGVEKIREGARAGFETTISGTDLIVGPRTGQVNLLLFTVFRIGEGMGGMSMESHDWVASRPEVTWTVPLSLGDSHRGFRVLGTTNAYFDHFRYGQQRALAFESGAPFADSHDVVIGSAVAAQLDYALGDAITVSHGLVSVDFAAHDAEFTIIGILAPTGTPVDSTVHVTLEGLAEAHEDLPGSGDSAQIGRRIGEPIGGDHEPDDHDEVHDHAPQQISAMLVGLRSRPLALRVQNDVNTYEGEPIMAILPGVTLAQLWGLIGVAETALIAISGFVILIGLLGLLTRILSSLNERRREMAILRALGARPGHVFSLLVLESALTAFAGSLFGLIILYAGLWGANAALSGSVSLPAFDAITGAVPGLFDLYVIAGVTALAALLGVLPGWLAYRNSLHDGLSIRV